MDAMTTHARNVGRIPDVMATEKFLDPILRQIEVENEEDRTKDIHRPEKKIGPRHLGAMADPDVRLVEKPGVEYLIDRDSGTAVRTDGGPIDPRGDLYREGTTVGDDDIPADVVQARLSFLHQIPSWREMVMTVWLEPHAGDCTPLRPCEAVKMCPDHGMRKVNKILGIVRRSFEIFGDPRKPVDPKIMIVTA